jgi:hypothetical protein
VRTETLRAFLLVKPRYLLNEWPIPAFEKPKAVRRFKSSLNRLWNEMRIEETAKTKMKAAKQQARGEAK